MRQELADMRKRWQDAVSRTETLAADMHESTSPLLRQIKALQEEARIKASAWASAGKKGSSSNFPGFGIEWYLCI